MKIGVFGGTFDPPHIGHLIVAEHVREVMGLDRLVLMPCALPPHKRDRSITPGEHRLEMTRLAIAGHTPFEVSALEVLRGGVSYTVDTLEEMHSASPHDELFFLLGMDNLAEFRTWREPDRILTLCRLIAMTRPGFEKAVRLTEEGDSVVYCEVPRIEVSGHEIRNRVRQGKSIAFLVPDAVRKYIRQKSFYL